MPYVNIKITREGATASQKAELIRGVTDLLMHVLDKRPATTFVVTIGALAACPSMNIESRTPKPNEARLQRHANRTSRRISWDLELDHFSLSSHHQPKERPQ